jgi:hypothetical protein
MFASFPNADIRPFSFFGHHGRDPHYGRDPAEMRRGFEAYAEELSLESERHWRSIIVYAAGMGGARFVESFVSVMQSRLPNVAIVGGICDGGYVTRDVLSRSNLMRSTVRRLRMIIHNLGGNERQMSAAVEKSDLVDLALRLQAQHSRVGMNWVEDGIFGAVLGGDVPVRSIVSRGVRSVTHGVPQPSSPYVVKTAELIPKQEGWHSESVHLIRDFLHRDTGRTIDAADILNRANVEPEFFGVRRPREDGFELHTLGQRKKETNKVKNLDLFAGQPIQIPDEKSKNGPKKRKNELPQAPTPYQSFSCYPLYYWLVTISHSSQKVTF